MKKTIAISIFLGMIGVVNSGTSPVMVGGKGSLPPAYLSVDGFKACMATKDMGGWTSYCMPAQKHSDCQLSSWDELVKMNIPNCNG
jgi:hypothetical protein